MNTLVTGANGGIGRALVDAAIERGDHVIAAMGPTGNAIPGEGTLRTVRLDLRDQDSIASLATSSPPLDRVFVCSGLSARRRDDAFGQETCQLGHLRAEPLLELLHVNAIGPLLLLQELPLAPDARVLVLSSRNASRGGRPLSASYGYSVSKSALNAAVHLLARELEATLIAVHPGSVITPIADAGAQLEPERCAQMLLSLAERVKAHQSGRFLNLDGSVHPD